jgi:hypothetical protein
VQLACTYNNNKVRSVKHCFVRHTKQAAVDRKIAGLSNFMQLLELRSQEETSSSSAPHQQDNQKFSVPVLVLIATAKDDNRKGCTTKLQDEGGTGWLLFA